MSVSTAALLKTTTIGLTVLLSLTACASDDQTSAPSPDSATSSELDATQAPDPTPAETALAETLEADFDVTRTMTMADQFPDFYALATALEETSDPDLCQQAGAAQYGLFVAAQPPNVRAEFDQDALLDEHASAETVTAFYATEQASAQQLQAAHEHTDTSCVEDYESAVDHEITEDTVGDDAVQIHTWQVVAADQLTGRMIDIVGDEIFVRYAATYPPQIMVAELEDDAATDFNAAALERATEVYAAAAAQ